MAIIIWRVSWMISNRMAMVSYVLLTSLKVRKIYIFQHLKFVDSNKKKAIELQARVESQRKMKNIIDCYKSILLMVITQKKLKNAHISKRLLHYTPIKEFNLKISLKIYLHVLWT